MWNVLWGMLIWAIGIISGDSVLYGDFSVLTVFFDAVGTFFIGKGLLEMYRRKSATPEPAAED